ncbi:MAG: GntR family transcriptional regulator [Planctomycetia bacterium]|nr:GntR family transcriptional regulator [Planctomycetia bacterium]
MNFSGSTYIVVVDYIKKKLASGELKIGDRLPTERELAEKLHLGRNTVREALRSLENTGLIEPRQGSGNYLVCDFERVYEHSVEVALLTRTIDFAEIAELRHGLDVLGYKLAYQNGTPKELRAIKIAREQLAQGRESSHAPELHSDFHRAIINATHNRLLMMVYNGLTKVFSCLIAETYKRFSLESFTDLAIVHDEICDALVERDFHKGIAALEEHFRIVYQYYTDKDVSETFNYIKSKTKSVRARRAKVGDVKATRKKKAKS